MKRKIVTLICCVIYAICSAPIYADEDCDLALREAKTAYNAGEYTKAKKLYDYVVSICGPSYGSASSWSQKCQDALTPKLSVSRSSISVSAYSGTTSITVTSNRTWKLTNTSSSLYTVSRNGDNISISYSANPNTTSRSDYFDVVTTDGSKSVRVYINQEAKANTSPYLSVNKTSIYSSASGTTEYITVSSNTTWEIQYPSATMYSVTRNGNTLTVKINANTSTDSRSNYFNVRTTDGSKVQKITLNQSGKSSSTSSSYNAPSTPTQYQINQMKSTIKSVWVDHNVIYGGEKCMKVHTHFSVDNMQGFQGYVIVWVYDSSGNSQTSYKTDAKYSKYINNNHSVLSWETFKPSYTSTLWKDFVLYIPNALLSTGGYIQVEIREYSTSKSLAWSNRVNFTRTSSESDQTSSLSNSKKCGFDDFYVDKQLFYVDASGGYYSLGIYGSSYVRLNKVWTNTNWLEEENLEYGGRQFHVKKNNSSQQRQGELYVTDTKGRKITVTVIQYGK